MADFANILAYCVVFWFDFTNIEEHGVSGKASNLVGVPFALGIAIYCYEGAGMVLALEASMYVAQNTTLNETGGGGQRLSVSVSVSVSVTVTVTVS